IIFFIFLSPSPLFFIVFSQFLRSNNQTFIPLILPPLFSFRSKSRGINDSIFLIYYYSIKQKNRQTVLFFLTIFC
ncbi:hypothetical protein CO116_02480, partial [Candidatus Falkowbacteria bacterium CG_4_9_14_3_um_filter_38_19]